MPGPLTRRAALTAFAAAPMALISGARPEPPPNAIVEAITLHRLAWDALGDTCNLTDEVLADREGRLITPADELTHRAALNGEQAAQDRIFAMAISSLAEMRSFVEWTCWIYDGGDGDLPDRFLESMRRAPIWAA